MSSPKCFSEYEFIEAIRTSKNFTECVCKLGYSRSVSVSDKTTKFGQMYRKLKPDISHFNHDSKSKYSETKGIDAKLQTVLNVLKRSRHKCFLTVEDLKLLIVNKKCFYCGGMNKRCIRENVYNINGIDRIDSNGDYSIDNVVPCCKNCNYAKNSLTQKDFLQHINKIYNYQQEKQNEINKIIR